MFRTVKSRKDYTGNKNCWTSVGDAFGGETAMAEFAAKIHQMICRISFQIR
jgi:hypothetical protein